jgi:ATP-dependent DNA helicase DinG
VKVESTANGAPLSEQVAAVFADDGVLARGLPAFEPRASQREMAGAVAEVFETGGTLLAEAGTGTGKTLAYLIPAVLKREPVLVSTGTKNLQEQIVAKDIPLLQQVLERPFTVTCMKGRGNYLCLHRLEALRNGAPALIDVALPERSAWIDRLASWSARSETGDRSELADMPDDMPLWHEVSASAENCLGTSCPKYHECFVTRMRQRAADSDIVVVNHHLLFADAALRQGDFGEVIPDCAHAVLDEAHQLEEIATQYFGVAVSTFRVEDLAGDAERWAVSTLRGRQRDAVLGGIERLRRHARRLFQSIGASSGRSDERVRFTADRRALAVEAGAEVCGTLEGLHGTLMLLQHAPDDGAAAIHGDALNDLIALARRTAALREDLRFLLDASDYEFVYFVETRGRGVHLRGAPIDVSKLVRSALLEHRHSTVLTSATLAVDGSFDFVRSRLGVRQARELRLASEFDFRSQSILYLPRRMPSPKDQSYAAAAGAEIVEILRRTRGRAFVLFTSYAMLRAIQPMLEAALAYPLLVQGTAPRGALVDLFRRTPNAVLLATSSFWQGVDVVGDALSCVIIDKLPFASPGDPVTAARLELIANRGGDPFAEYQVPLAVLTLQQGLGRLLRHRRDRGVLAVLDPRLKTMGYGRRFLASLPPAPVTSSLGDVEDFFSE